MSSFSFSLFVPYAQYLTMTLTSVLIHSKAMTSTPRVQTVHGRGNDDIDILGLWVLVTSEVITSTPIDVDCSSSGGSKVMVKAATQFWMQNKSAVVNYCSFLTQHSLNP